MRHPDSANTLRAARVSAFCGLSLRGGVFRSVAKRCTLARVAPCFPCVTWMVPEKRAPRKFEGGGVPAQPRKGRLMSTRFPRSAFGRGSEPDPRFSLANERTFLAWIRTSLALIAGGVALEALALPIQAELRIAASALFVVLGLLAALQSWFGWARNERSLRMQRALPGPTLGAVIAAGLGIGIVLVSVGFLLR